jgi:hypothetical protein
MKVSLNKKSLKKQIRKFLSREEHTPNPIKTGKGTRTVTQVDHAAGSYEIVEYGDATEEEAEII